MKGEGPLSTRFGGGPSMSRWASQSSSRPSTSLRRKSSGRGPRPPKSSFACDGRGPRLSTPCPASIPSIARPHTAARRSVGAGAGPRLSEGRRPNAASSTRVGSQRKRPRRAAVCGRALPVRKRRSLLQHLIGATKLEIVAFRFSQSLPFVGGESRSSARVTLRLLHPTSQGLGRAPDLLSDRANRGPLGYVGWPVVLYQPHRALMHLCRKPSLSRFLRHDSILSKDGASNNPGAIRGACACLTNDAWSLS